MKLLKITAFLLSSTVLLSANNDAPLSTDMFQLDPGASVGASVGTIGMDAEYTHMISKQYGLAFRLMGGAVSPIVVPMKIPILHTIRILH